MKLGLICSMPIIAPPKNVQLESDMRFIRQSIETLFRDVALSTDVKRMSHKLIGSTKDRGVEMKAERNERKV